VRQRGPNAISVLAVANRGSMYDPSAVFYMSKLATGQAAADLVDITAPPAANIRAVAKAKGCGPQDVTVVILDRPRAPGADHAGPRDWGRGST